MKTIYTQTRKDAPRANERIFTANLHENHCLKLFCTMNSTINPHGTGSPSKLMIIDECVSTTSLKTALEEHETNRKSVDAIASSLVEFSKENRCEIVIVDKLSWLADPVKRAVARQSRASIMRLGYE